MIPENGYLIVVDLELQKLPIELNSENQFEGIYSISVLDKWGTYIIADDPNKILERQRYPYFEWYILFELNQVHMYREMERLSFGALVVWIVVISLMAYLLRRYFKYIYRDIHILTSKTEALIQGAC